MKGRIEISYPQAEKTKYYPFPKVAGNKPNMADPDPDMAA
jgi:hypothetical protein